MTNVPYEEEQLTDGLVYSKYHPHIHAFTFTNMSKETVDAVYSAIIALDKDYAEKGIHVQYLYTFDQVLITPYMLKNLKQAIDATPENLQDSSAIVADTFLTRVLETFISPLIKFIAPDGIRYFSVEAEAFNWLEERRNASGD